MSEVADPCAKWVAGRLGADWVDGTWEERLRRLVQEPLEIGWVCGLIHATRLPTAPWKHSAVAAAVMSGDRYENSPVYFSDVVVAPSSRFVTLDSADEMVFAFNDRTSLSGYEMMVRHLGSAAVFKDTIETGSHMSSMEALRSGDADVAIIDSTVRDMLRLRGELPDLRTISQIGPYPAPPIVVSHSLEDGVVDELRTRLTTLHLDPEGRDALASWGIARFAQVDDATYHDLAQQ